MYVVILFHVIGTGTRLRPEQSGNPLSLHSNEYILSVNGLDRVWIVGFRGGSSVSDDPASGGEV